MLRRTRRPLACVPILCMLCTVIATPTVALARAPRSGSGGAGIGGGGAATTPSSGTTTFSMAATTTTTTTTTAPGVIELGGVVNASGDGISLTVAASGTQGRPLTISGEAPAGDTGEIIYIEAAKAGHSNWTQVATATIAASGAFSARWTPSSNGQLELRAVLSAAVTGGTGSRDSADLSSDTGGSASTASGELSTSPLRIPIFRNAIATLYGPGFWGHHTACGQRLTHATLGVASRTLKCGTEVAVLYRGRELTVPVIDRGPFANHASWDLTMATAKALGIRQTATIGTLTSVLPPSFAAGS